MSDLTVRLRLIAEFMSDSGMKDGVLEAADRLDQLEAELAEFVPATSYSKITGDLYDDTYYRIKREVTDDE